MTIQFISEIDVQVIQQMGSDEMIVRAMLVSTGKDQIDLTEKGITGRLNFLIEKRHGTPFECGAITVRGHAPIKVWREWHRHRIGFSYNEESGRYKQLEPVFYIPPPYRPMIRPDHFKSSSPDFAIADDQTYKEMVQELMQGYTEAYTRYEKLLEMGIDRGLARDVLGVGIYSSCYVTMNPRSMMAFLELRIREDEAKRPSRPLFEIDVAARKVEAIFAKYWPITYKLWNEHGRMAP